jgi:glycosyltransferase involved in cell wall biosynthesis
MKRHLLVLDPTAFRGGSKIATENILRLLNTDETAITVLTSDMQSWKWSRIRRMRMRQPGLLANAETGIPYFLRHALVLLNLLLARLLHGRVDAVLGASGPGVDLALYMGRPFLGYRLIQLVHGPVANSRTIARCLAKADEVHYLGSSEESILSSLATIGIEPIGLDTMPGFYLMENGLSEHAWPTRSRTTRPVLFWSASLLKWKGLDTLLEALAGIPVEMRPETHLCYIRPRNTRLPVTDAPVPVERVSWHEDPEALDTIRASASLFVSTSRGEPFGLSILEALAAGHCVLIPADGAYWDGVLEDGINCIKYAPADANDLARKILNIAGNMKLAARIGENAAQLALGYRARLKYAVIRNSLQPGPQVSARDQHLGEHV